MEPAQVARRLDSGHSVGDGNILRQRHEPLLQSGGVLGSLVEERLVQGHAKGGNKRGLAQHTPHRPGPQAFIKNGHRADEHAKARANVAQDGTHEIQLAGTFLEPNHIGQAREFADGHRIDIESRELWNGIDQHRALDPRRHPSVVGHQGIAVHARLVIIRGQNQQRVGPALDRFLAEGGA